MLCFLTSEPGLMGYIVGYKTDVLDIPGDDEGTRPHTIPSQKAKGDLIPSDFPRL